MHYSKPSHLRTYSSFLCLQLFSLSAPHCKSRDPASKAKWPPPERDLAEEVTGQAQGLWCIPVLPSTPAMPRFGLNSSWLAYDFKSPGSFSSLLGGCRSSFSLYLVIALPLTLFSLPPSCSKRPTVLFLSNCSPSSAGSPLHPVVFAVHLLVSSQQAILASLLSPAF